MTHHPEADGIIDGQPPHWAVERAMDIADLTHPRITNAIVDLIAMNLWLAFTKGETNALNSIASEKRNARAS